MTGRMEAQNCVVANNLNLKL